MVMRGEVGIGDGNEGGKGQGKGRELGIGGMMGWSMLLLELLSNGDWVPA